MRNATSWGGLWTFVLCACGGATVTFPDAGDDSGAPDATLPPDGGSPDGAATDGGADAPAADGGADACGPTQCSPSTHEILDCNGQVLATCAANEACDVQQIKCVPACQAQPNNRQSTGCDFWPAYLDVYNGVSLKCHAVVVANTWGANAKLAVDYNGQSLTVANFARLPQGSGMSLTYAAYDPMTGLKPGEVAILFLAGGTGAGVGCPVAPAINGTSPMLVGTTMGKAFHLTSDLPVAVYQINPYGGGGAAVTGASLLLPSTAWGSNYVANTASPFQIAPPAFDVVAAENNTQVKVLPTVAVTGGGGVPNGPANQTLTFNLNAGEVAQLSQNADLAGSIIETSKPVGVFSSSACMNVPTGTGFCDHGEQMLLPIKALGSEYAAVPYRARSNEPSLWRVVGAVAGTTLTYSPAVNGAPSAVGKGQFVDFEAPGPFVVNSQDAAHPFELLAYMSGGAWVKLSQQGWGDPDHVVVTPPGQFLRSYVFFSDPTFPETNLVVVRAKNGNAFEDVNLDCLGKLGGWTALGASYEWTRTDLQTGNYQAVGNCSNGRHTIDSKGPFGISVWGWGAPSTNPPSPYVSYGYPGGTNVRAINNVVVPAQ